MRFLFTADGARILFVAAAAAVVSSGIIGNPSVAMAVGIVAVIVGGYEMLLEAAHSLLRRKMTMELSMLIAVAAALAIREVSTALLILIFVLVAEVLEEMNVHRGRRAISELVEMLPRRAALLRDGRVIDIATEQLRPGDVILIRPGTRIPADGIVLSGHSAVDQSSVTGESLPADKTAGADVFAGTLNQSGSLEMRVVALGADTTFGKIMKVIEESETSRAPVQKLADRLAAVIVAVALSAALITFLVVRDPRAAIAVVIVSGACGVAAGTPLAILAGIGQCARRNVIVKGGVVLERLAVVDAVVFDKTGTLTLGQPQVSNVLPAASYTASDIFRLAGTAERHSEHPIAAAVVRAAEERGVTFDSVSDFEMLPGRGVICRSASGSQIIAGNRVLLEETSSEIPTEALTDTTSVYVSVDGRYAGRIEVSDLPRERSSHAVAALHALGIRTVLMTGDRASIARTIGGAIGIDEIDAELLPDEKRKRICELQSVGHVVAMVGDGINDAPALIAADVGIAMGSGTEIAQETADVLLLGDDPSRVAEAIGIARACRNVILQNFIGTIVVDAIGIALAAARFLHPVSAAIVHVGSELLFILNSARLLPSMSKPKN